MKMSLTAWEICAVETALALTWQRNDEPIEPKGLALLIARFKDAKYVTIETETMTARTRVTAPKKAFGWSTRDSDTG